MMKTLAGTTGPSLLHLCFCGHRAGEHPRKGERPCQVLACQCQRYEWVPPSGCVTCRHPPSLHSPRSPQDPWGCAAPGCGCQQWQSAPATDNNHDNRGNHRNDDNHGDDDACSVFMEAGDGRVTITIPSQAKREVRISQIETGIEIVLSRPTRTRGVSTTHAADRSG
jgi:hypothetical protein